MDSSNPAIDFLHDPLVKARFLQLLESPLSAEERYQAFLDFCASQMAQSHNGAQEQAVLLAPRLVESISRAAWRIQRSQHQDGGWGPQIEQSTFWHTAYTVLFLCAAHTVSRPDRMPDLESLMHRGAAYLEQHPDAWATDTLSTADGMPVSAVALMIRCFYRLGRAYLRRETALRIYRSIDRLYHSQNADGGWDASIWGYEVSTPTRVWSEVSATGAAVQALAETRDERFYPALEKGLGWLARTQNADGSWNNGSCSPDTSDFQLSGEPAITRTCDALQGLQAGGRSGISLEPYQACMHRAVNWLHQQEKPVLDRQKHLTGWGWGYSAVDYEHTCLTLETLLPTEPLDGLAASVAWLIQGQRRQTDDPDDGSWALGHTARIGLALLMFYQRLLESARI